MLIIHFDQPTVLNLQYAQDLLRVQNLSSIFKQLPNGPNGPNPILWTFLKSGKTDAQDFK